MFGPINHVQFSSGLWRNFFGLHFDSAPSNLKVTCNLIVSFYLANFKKVLFSLQFTNTPKATTLIFLFWFLSYSTNHI